MSTTAPPAELVAAHLSTRLFQPLLRQLVDRAGHPAVDGMARDAGLGLEWLEDDEHWVSAEFVRRFTPAVVRRLYGIEGLPPYDHPCWQVWREAGRDVSPTRSLGALWYLVRAAGSPTMIYRAMPAKMHHGCRLTDCVKAEVRAGRATFRFQPAQPEDYDDAAMCWNRLGLLEGMPCIWGLPRAVVRHVACLHDPDSPAPWCEYEVRFQERRWTRVARSVAAAALGAGAGAAATVPLAWPLAAGVLAGAATGLGINGWIRFLRAAAKARQDGALMSDQLDLADRRYQEIWRERDQLRRALLTNRKIAGYLPSTVVDEIARDPEAETRLGGSRVAAAVLFSDLVGFTARCDSAAPEAVVEDLNLFFSHADPVIARHEGIIDKRLGDGILAVFTGRRPGEGRDLLRRRAVACGLDLIDSLGDCNAELRRRGSEPFDMRVAVTTGSVVQGNLGSGVRLEFTVIGDVVNLASRLNGHGTPGRVITEADAAPDDAETSWRTVDRRSVSVRGLAAPVDVVEIVRERASA